ncbi:MAG: FAD-binding oxidoreductase, partial [Desulfovibrionales bacterium]
MPNKSPHISIAADQLMDRVLEIAPNEFKTWPESIRDLALALAEELFLIRYNPFIPADLVWRSVQSRLRNESFTLTEEYFHPLKQALDRYWAKYQADMEFRRNLVENLGRFMPADSIVSSAHTLVECATDATDLRMELPLLVLFPADTDEIRRILILANEMGFSVVPRGGGSGLTGGAVPGNSRAVVLSLSKMKKITRVDREEMALCAQSGVITLNAIQAAAKKGMLLTVDPASKAASSLGGNISENAGGPFAFEYGTTLDNILSYTMVQPTGSIREVRRKDHPRHKILPNEKVV